MAAAAMATMAATCPSPRYSSNPTSRRTPTTDAAKTCKFEAYRRASSLSERLGGPFAQPEQRHGFEGADVADGLDEGIGGEQAHGVRMTDRNADHEPAEDPAGERQILPHCETLGGPDRLRPAGLWRGLLLVHFVDIPSTRSA